MAVRTSEGFSGIWVFFLVSAHNEFQKANGLVQKAIGPSTAWLKQGVKNVEEGFKESLKDLAAVGSQFARMFRGRELSPADGALIPDDINLFEKLMPEKIPRKTEVQINYEKVMKELEEEAEKRATMGADPTGDIGTPHRYGD
ncbi:hypothetical protein [Paenibacillus fonticola]|uniref:hypothetical protein n=1 Tax=Paenibacillus fonticola TaxID=379896 RepID=UPI000361A10F|nr:hypothetical protein [Paenibacillus fonticola]